LLLRSIKSTSGSEVAISSDGQHATLSCGQSKFKLPALPAVDFPEMKMLTDAAPYNFDLPASTILKAKASIGFARSDSAVQYWLNGTSLLIADGCLEFCATDRHKLSLLSVRAPIASIPETIIPDLDLPAWEGTVCITLSDQWIRYTSGGQILASKLISGSFPTQYRRAIPDNKNIVLFDRAEMLSAVVRARLIAHRGHEHSILFAGKDGKISVSAVTDRGESDDSVSFEGEDFRIAIASGVIEPILRSFDCEIMEWRVGDHATATSLHDPNDPSRITLAMPYHDNRVLAGAPQEQQAAAA
jgi:DNA polymerase-3 subunit beta